MSKIGKKPIIMPEWVELNLDWSKVTVKWPLGELTYNLVDWVILKQEDNQIIVSVSDLEKWNLWGLTRTLVDNMVVGVSKWFEKKLLLMWVWYNVKAEWTDLNFAIWFSHRVKFIVPSDIKVVIEQDAKWAFMMTVSWIDKQKVWEISAQIRWLKEPEPYKGKGIRYSDEYLKLKPGKAAKK